MKISRNHLIFSRFDKKTTFPKKNLKFFFCKRRTKNHKKRKKSSDLLKCQYSVRYGPKLWGGGTPPAARVLFCFRAHIWHPKIANLGTPKTTFPKKFPKEFFDNPCIFWEFRKKSVWSPSEHCQGPKSSKNQFFHVFDMFFLDQSGKIKSRSWSSNLVGKKKIMF